MASIHAHKSGGHLVRWYGGLNAQGERVRHNKVMPTLAEARAYVRKVASAEGHASANGQIGPAMLGWIDTRETMGAIAAKTADRERGIARTWGNMLGPVPVTRLDAAAIQKALNEMVTKGGPSGRPMAARTLHHHRQKLSQFLQSLVDAGELPRNAVRGTVSPKLSKVKALAPSRTQAEALLALADASGACAGQLGIIVRVAMQTGMRRGEILALKWSDIDLNAGEIKVQRTVQQVDGKITFKPPKTDAGNRTLPISATMVERLRAQKARQAQARLSAGTAWVDNDLVVANGLGEVVNPEEVSRRAGDLRKRIEGWPANCAPLHGLRHLHGTMLNSAGVDAKTIQTRLGHEDIKITLQLYVHPCDENARAAADIFEGLG